mmetsp:Transcript_14903/g.43530  ORF Transcript_14903/g.43530 Transcript_14903/m.43530 type:complete len:264 (-) Transcript_14903:549-1340(-)
MRSDIAARRSRSAGESNSPMICFIWWDGLAVASLLLLRPWMSWSISDVARFSVSKCSSLWRMSFTCSLNAVFSRASCCTLSSTVLLPTGRLAAEEDADMQAGRLKLVSFDPSLDDIGESSSRRTRPRSALAASAELWRLCCTGSGGISKLQLAAQPPGARTHVVGLCVDASQARISARRVSDHSMTWKSSGASPAISGTEVVAPSACAARALAGRSPRATLGLGAGLVRPWGKGLAARGERHRSDTKTPDSELWSCGDEGERH